MAEENINKPWYKKGSVIAVIVIILLLAVWFIHKKEEQPKVEVPATSGTAKSEITISKAPYLDTDGDIPDVDFIKEPGKAETHEGIVKYTEGKYDEAKAALERAASEGNADAKALLGKMYILGHGVVKDTEKGLDYLEDGVEHGSSYAMAELGKLYVSGKHGVEKESDKGLSLIKRAMEDGKYYGHLAMARLYELGEGVEHSIEKAIDYVKEAGERGYKHAAEEIKRLEAKL